MLVVDKNGAGLCRVSGEFFAVRGESVRVWVDRNSVERGESRVPS